jgi:F-type H+-transporting ATPase subunit epsilon
MMLYVAVITPDRSVYAGDAESVSLPTAQGEITVLPHHIPLISVVAPGTLTIRKGGEETLVAVTRGVVEIDGRSLRVLVDTADRAEELEEAAVLQAKQRAENLLKERRHDAEGFAEATALLEREISKLQVVRRHRSRRRV